MPNRAMPQPTTRRNVVVRAQRPDLDVDAEPATLDPLVAAEAAQLHYVSDHFPGITRVCAGDGFIYRDPAGQVIRDPRELQRFKSLRIPPAWTDVWICTDPNRHIQAVGRDQPGRKQYIYHPRRPH